MAPHAHTNGSLQVRRLALLALLAAAVGCGPASPPDPQPALEQMVAGKWAGYSESIGYPGAGGLVLHVSTPKGSHFASTGLENASPGIHFRIASNTKTFTAAAIMLLEQRGQLHLDDPITASIPGTATPYVPDSAEYAIPYKGSITIRKLLSHTAGVFDVTNSEFPADAPCPYAGMNYLQVQDLSRQFTFDELVGAVAMCQASYSSPTENKYHYSNTGYTLLGKVIERVSGLSYSGFIVRELLEPNGLTETSSPSANTDMALPAPFAIGYSLDYLGSGKLVATVGDNMSINVAEGNLVSTPGELARWIRTLLTGAAGVDGPTAESMKCALPAGATSCYGLGIEQRPGLGFGHTGAHNGYVSVMYYDPANDVSLVLFANLFNADDLATEGLLLLDVARQARAILGY